MMTKGDALTFAIQYAFAVFKRSKLKTSMPSDVGTPTGRPSISPCFSQIHIHRQLSPERRYHAGEAERRRKHRSSEDCPRGPGTICLTTRKGAKKENSQHLHRLTEQKRMKIREFWAARSARQRTEKHPSRHLRRLERCDCEATGHYLQLATRLLLAASDDFALFENPFSFAFLRCYVLHSGFLRLSGWLQFCLALIRKRGVRVLHTLMTNKVIRDSSEAADVPRARETMFT
jgi:hypothetical protein